MDGNIKNKLAITLAILVIGLMPLAGGCTDKSVFIPEPLQLESPPILITADQLYAEYLEDEVATVARYEGKELWITEILVDSYIESESGNYLTIQGYQFMSEMDTRGNLQLSPLSTLSTIILGPQIAHDFDLTDVAKGYTAEVYGEFQGISEEVAIRETDEDSLFIPMVILIEISKIIAITEEGAMPEAPAPVY